MHLVAIHHLFSYLADLYPAFPPRAQGYLGSILFFPFPPTIAILQGDQDSESAFGPKSPGSSVSEGEFEAVSLVLD